MQIDINVSDRWRNSMDRLNMIENPDLFQTILGKTQHFPNKIREHLSTIITNLEEKLAQVHN